MDSRTLLALGLLLLTVVGVGAALFYVTREQRRERRAHRRGERARLKARDERRARDAAA